MHFDLTTIFVIWMLNFMIDLFNFELSILFISSFYLFRCRIKYIRALVSETTGTFWRISDWFISDNFPTDLFSTTFRQKLYRQTSDENSPTKFWRVFSVGVSIRFPTDSNYWPWISVSPFPSLICWKQLLPRDFRRKNLSLMTCNPHEEVLHTIGFSIL